MPRIGRRKFLKISSAGTLAASSGGIAGILASSRAPAFAQGTTLHWLRWNDFIPQSDALLRDNAQPRFFNEGVDRPGQISPRRIGLQYGESTLDRHDVPG